MGPEQRSRPRSDPGPVRAISSSPNEFKALVSPRGGQQALAQPRPPGEPVPAPVTASHQPLGPFRRWEPRRNPVGSFYGVSISELQIARVEALALSRALAVAAEPKESEGPGPWHVRPLGASRLKAHHDVASLFQAYPSPALREPQAGTSAVTSDGTGGPAQQEADGLPCAWEAIVHFSQGSSGKELPANYPPNRCCENLGLTRGPIDLLPTHCFHFRQLLPS
ncbi:uncharacterized protein LOC115297743 [Suricata suricatta]|uniref:uncharacterized protein LOC115297743 n=1 Tax=Suricata suricatta TaxID=37032 RepID=UPI001155D909|nr:uncharacterized protein LOC115297743 [Suricata suricatta]